MEPPITKEELELCLKAKSELERALFRSMYAYVHIHGIEVKVDLLKIVSVSQDVENGTVEFAGEERCGGSTEYHSVEFPLRFVYDMEYREKLEIAAIEKLRDEEIADDRAKKEAASAKEKRERALYEALKAKFEPVEE